MDRIRHLRQIQDPAQNPLRGHGKLAGVKNSTFYLPVFLHNNGMNLTIGGERSSDDRLATASGNAGRVLANKFKKNNRNVESAPAKRTAFSTFISSPAAPLGSQVRDEEAQGEGYVRNAERVVKRASKELHRAFGIAPWLTVRNRRAGEDRGEQVQRKREEKVYFGAFKGVV
ncbi:MAG: hypothetical protein IPN76_27810 [Saprospiraceae bacterium]|nr:hypothetical protein [Saprospiraceae bacterium]